MTSPTRCLARLTVATLAGALLATSAPALADHATPPPGRKLVKHTVKPGDTATGLAVRYHAWTAELISFNHLGSSATVRVGEQLAIPVVRSAARADRRTSKHAARKPAARKPAARKPAARKPAARYPGRAHVRNVIAATARRHGVDPQLALAVSWQEAGWQMHHVSSADAIGAMQVIPTTGTWMSIYAGRSLKLRDTGDNALAGVLLLGVLGDSTRTERRRIGAYYQGLGAVRRHGLYAETERYVDNVLAIKRRLERGLPPAA